MLAYSITLYACNPL